MFTSRDLEQIHARGIDTETIERQIGYFRKGFPFIMLDRPAIPGDGIFTFSPGEKDHFIHYYKQNMGSRRILKFVPASGAASRMFKTLFEFRSAFDGNPGLRESYRGDPAWKPVAELVDNLEKFAFYEDLAKILARRGLTMSADPGERDPFALISAILDEDGLNYAGLPKALLKFHGYPEGSRTALEEHLVEAARYVKDNQGISRIHFTVSPEHLEKFMEKTASVKDYYETAFNTAFDISFSVQKSSTDTLAVDEDNEPFRNDDGSLLFRPAGHGALLGNLEDTDAEIVFIKNIDNIVPDHLKVSTIDHKMLIGGYLVWIREQINNFLEKAEKGQVTSGDIEKMAGFAADALMIPLPEGFAVKDEDARIEILRKLLNRPVRVCGMVKNEGEPGGGPYWVKEQNGRKSLQIVESSQVNLKDPDQKNIFSGATHFNPVDLVCSIRDYKGNKFRLDEFTDPDTGFISLKSSGGRVLKAQELPGLWNGSMAGWITVFVEVPVITFNPVKTINDLLRKEHQ